MAAATQTQAEKIAKSGKATGDLKDAVENVQAAAKQQAEGIRTALKTGELRNRVHVEEVMRYAAQADTEEDTSEIAKKALSAVERGEVTENNARNYSGMNAEQARDRAEEVAEEWLETGCYAYRFEQLDDGSVLAVFVTGEDAEPEFVAFADMAETAGWHPTRAPKE